MSEENPYTSPQVPGEPSITDRELSLDERRLTPKQVRWITHGRYALRVLYVFSGLLVLQGAGQLFVVQVFQDPYSPFPLPEEQRIQIFAINVAYILAGGGITISLRRFDRVLGQVLYHDAAGAAVNRAIRLGRNALFALAAGIGLLVLAGLAIATWTFVRGGSWAG